MQLTPITYISLRILLSQQALKDVTSSLRHGLPLLLIVLGPVFLGLAALLTVPLFLAATFEMPTAALFIVGQGSAFALPFMLLRHRLLPDHFLNWEHTLPVPRSLPYLADGLVALKTLQPLALAYAFSAAIWLWQAPGWLQAVRMSGLLSITLAFVVSWVLLTIGLSALRFPPRHRVRFQRHERRHPATIEISGHCPSLRTYFFLWVLPFCRATGRRVTFALASLCVLAIGSAVCWACWRGAQGDIKAVPPCVFAAILMTITTRASDHGNSLLERLSPYLAALPLHQHHSRRVMMAISLLPSTLSLIGLGIVMVAAFPKVDTALGISYLAVSALLCTTVVFRTKPRSGTRQALALLSFTLLSFLGNAL